MPASIVLSTAVAARFLIPSQPSSALALGPSCVRTRASRGTSRPVSPRRRPSPPAVVVAKAEPPGRSEPPAPVVSPSTPATNSPLDASALPDALTMQAAARFLAVSTQHLRRLVAEDPACPRPWDVRLPGTDKAWWRFETVALAAYREALKERVQGPRLESFTPAAHDVPDFLLTPAQRRRRQGR